jgi:hypothetical protein
MMGVLGLLLALCCVEAPKPVTVAVDATTNLVLGDEAAVAGTLFGVTAFEGFTAVIGDADLRAKVAAAEFGAYRFPAPADWFAPQGAKPEWFDTSDAARVLEETLLYGARYPLARFLRMCRGLGAEPMMQLGVGDKLVKADEAGVPLDFQQWSDWAVALTGAMKRADPALRLVQVWNEPNASWWKSAARFKDVPGGYAGGHDQLFNLAARAIKKKFPDMQVVGPVLCWPPTWPPHQQYKQPWYTWDEFTLPFLRDTAETADFFDFHSYGVDGDNVQTQIEVVAAASERMNGKRLRTWITESGFELPEAEWGTPAEWMKRAIPYERFLWGLLGQTDKCAGNMAHDLHAKAFAVAPAADDLRPEYWVFWIFRDLRGTRLAATSEAEEVKVAATTREDAVTVVCFNDSAEARSVKLQVAIPAGWWTGPEVRALVPAGDGKTFRAGTVEVKAAHNPNEATLEFEMPALATVSIILRPDHYLQPARKVVVREAFARPEMVDISKAGQARKVALSLPAALSEAAQPRLRVGLLGATEKCKVTAKLGGKAYVLAPKAWQEVPIGALEAGEQEIEFEAAGEVPDNLRLAFAALSYREVTGAK